MSRLALRFRIAGIPVLVEPGFWLITALLAMTSSSRDFMVWVPVVFVSVLAHELGHAFMAKAFGAKPEVTLYMMGGVTRSAHPEGQPYSRWRSALVTLAGPGAGFFIAACVAAYAHLRPPAEGTTTAQVIAVLMFVNLGWGLVNLLPVLPLDGGNLMRALLAGPGFEAGTIRALWVSIIVGPLVVLASLPLEMLFVPMLFAFFTYSSGRQLYELVRTRKDRNDGLADQLERAHQHLVDGDPERAEQVAKDVAARARTKMLRVAALHFVAFANLELGQPGKAFEVLDRMPPDEVDPFLMGACLLALDRPREAIRPLEQAVEMGRQPRAVDLLVQALQQDGQQERADELMRAMREIMPETGRRH